MEVSKFIRLESGYTSFEHYNDDRRLMLKHALEQYLNEGISSSLNHSDKNQNTSHTDFKEFEEMLVNLSHNSKFYSTYTYISKLDTTNQNSTSLIRESILSLENLAYRRFIDCAGGEIHPHLKNYLGELFKSRTLEKTIEVEDWFFFKELLSLDVSDKYIEFYLENFYQDIFTLKMFDKFHEVVQLYSRTTSLLNPILEKNIQDYLLEYYKNVVKPVLISDISQARITNDFVIEIVSNVVSMLKVLKKQESYSDIQASLFNYLNYVHNYVIDNMKSDSVKFYNSEQSENALILIDKIIEFYNLTSVFGKHDSRLNYFKKAHNDLIINHSIYLTNQKNFSSSNLNLRKTYSMILDKNQTETIGKLEEINNAGIKREILQDRIEFMPKQQRTVSKVRYESQSRNRRGSPLAGLIILIAVVISISIFSQPDSDEKKPLSNPIDENLVERPYPANGEVLSGPIFIDEDSLSYLKVNASSEYSHVIKLYTPYTDDLVIMFFVRAGQTAKVEIPVGVYEIRVADGKKWYGVDNWFGVNTIATRHDEMYTFDQNSEWTITLFRVKDGNLTSTRIDIEDF